MIQSPLTHRRGGRPRNLALRPLCVLLLLGAAACDPASGRERGPAPLDASPGEPAASEAGLDLPFEAGPGIDRGGGESSRPDGPGADRTGALDARPAERHLDLAADAGPAAGFYIAPWGADGNPGSAAQPWRTFQHAIPRLNPGDTLILLDGVYTGSSTGYPSISCPGGARHGTASQPITVRAQNERQAFLKGDGSASPFSITGCSYWIITGLRAENGDFAAEPTPGSVFVVNGCQNLVLRRLLGARNNRYKNSHVILIGGSSSCLVEECEVYSFHRHGIIGYASSKLTYRRCYAHSRGHADISGGYGSADASRGDEGLSFYLTGASLAENCISEASDLSFSIHADDAASGDSGVPDGNRYFGCIGLGSGAGFYLDSRCNGQSPCSSADRIVSNTTYQSCLALNTDAGFAFIGGQGNQVLGCSAITSKWQGVELLQSSANLVNSNAGLTSSASVSNTLALGPSGMGFYALGQASWSFEHCASFANNQSFVPQDGHVIAPLLLDPKLGACRVYLPAGSPLKGAGKNGLDVGASIVFRYQAGVLTSSKLWNQSSGAFPCGAVVAGVNDTPASSCSGVHARLNVGVNGCPVP